ncbi:ferritin-like domain-containing protein [Leptothoe sp. EHU-05/26/07-4]
MTIPNLRKVSGFDLPTLTANNKINRILTAALGEREIINESNASSIYWQPQYFDLDRVSIFQESADCEQHHILQQLNRGLLQESLFIEQAGVGYMAKMVLLADSAQERMLYSLFAADETMHLAQLQPYAASDIAPTELNDPFLQLLSDIVESADKTVLLFVLQVVLEGWGLTHYRSLARACTDSSLRALFQSFLQAEARHHGTGVTLLNQAEISGNSKAAIVDCLATFLQMVRIGPQRVVAAIATTKGHLSRPQRIQILQQLDTVTHGHQRLQLLKHLMASTNHGIVSQLADQDLFTPLNAEEAANYG